ncbi:hypothetical protein TNCV_2808551 [Trichonephila clavipes]|nr:hypothetical protein TNCV_2808551 [Trichonephila clavipes]
MDEVSDLIEIHIFCDASKLAYGAAAYVKALLKMETIRGKQVQEISELTDPDSWFHCSGQDNPSDFLSRGLVLIHLFPTTNGGLVSLPKNDELPKTVSGVRN